MVHPHHSEQRVDSLDGKSLWVSERVFLQGLVFLWLCVCEWSGSFNERIVIYYLISRYGLRVIVYPV